MRGGGGVVLDPLKRGDGVSTLPLGKKKKLAQSAENLFDGLQQVPEVAASLDGMRWQGGPPTAGDGGSAAWAGHRPHPVSNPA